MTLTKQGAFTKKVTDLPDTPSPDFTPTEIKTYFQTPPDELKVTLNKVIDDLSANTGATQIGAKDSAGVTSNVQGELDKKTNKTGDHLGTWQGLTPGEAGEAINGGRLDIIEAELENVKRYGAKGDGVTDDSTNIQSAIDTLIAEGRQNLFFPPGDYIASGLFNNDKVNFVGEGASFVNDTYYIHPYGMQGKKVRLAKGQNSGNFFISTEGTHKEIADEDTVALQVVSGSRTDFANGGIEYPRVWGMNAIVAKHEDFPTSYVIGHEVSMVNYTTDHTDVIGFLSSYVGMQEGGKSAFESTGNTAGWTYGLVVDAVKPTGTGIALQDTVSSNGGMEVGIDFSGVSSFPSGAILLGNNHFISAKNTSGVSKQVLKVNGSNDLFIGGDLGGTGYLIIRNVGSGVSIQNKAGSSHILVDDTGSNPVRIHVGGALKTVEVGAVDSAGVGYRTLRVAN